MRRFTTKVRTAMALGVPNIGRAMGYRVGVKLGLNPVRRLKAEKPEGPFFGLATGVGPIAAPATTAWKTSASLFGHWKFEVSGEAPDWLANPFNGQRAAASALAWWQIPDFDPVTGDIKLIWELSRMDWALAFAQRARSGDTESLRRLNTWLADWCASNPPYRGPNWKCGQEASLRVMHLAMAALVLEQVWKPLPGLQALVCLHLQRIGPTLQYAMAQDNNHGTSEAAALFIGGSWLAALGDPRGAEWMRVGRRWLEDRAARLIGPQGSFSQYSLNYHRVMLDTFCMAEVWRRHLMLPEFSPKWQAQALAATQWLYHSIDPSNGDGPNVGANDGARLLQLTDGDYRDHRPSVQIAMVLFAKQRAYHQDGQWNFPLQWLGIQLPTSVAPEAAQYIADDGGFAFLRQDGAMAMLRYPRFRFRPSQADALHLDLWIGGKNLLRDAGTYSYNAAPRWQDYFGGTGSHNTIQFDERDQMPRLSRFLFGDWLKARQLEALSVDERAVHYGAGYLDGHGASHHRRVSLGANNLRVQDDVSGFAQQAVMRWRLAPGSWGLTRTPEAIHLTNEAEKITLSVSTSMPVIRCELIEGWESRHYLEKKALPVLEIEVQQPGTIITEVRWPA